MTYGANQRVTLDANLAPVSHARVVPRCVFAAGRKSFEATVRNVATVETAKVILFLELPLAQNGWDRTKTIIRKIGITHDGLIVRVERGAP